VTVVYFLLDVALAALEFAMRVVRGVLDIFKARRIA